MRSGPLVHCLQSQGLSGQLLLIKHFSQAAQACCSVVCGTGDWFFPHCQLVVRGQGPTT